MLNQHEELPKLSTPHERNLAIKVKFVDAVFKGDWDGMAATLHKDFKLHEPSDLPYGGVYEGFEGFKRFWLMTKDHKSEKLETIATYFTDDPNEIVVELLATGAMLDTGDRFTAKIMEKFTFADDRIIGITMYFFDLPATAARAAK